LMLTSVAIVAAAGSAMAADMSAPFKASPAIAPVYNWTGCYAGIHGGGAAIRDNFATTWSEGGLFGGQVGCNYQIDHLVVGVEGEAAWSGVNSTQHLSTFGGGTAQTQTFKNDWDADVAFRFGLAYDRFFIYDKIGVMWGNHKFTNTQATVPFSNSGSATLPGLLWGFGIEYALTGQWTVKVETDFVQFAATDMNFTCTGACAGQISTASANSVAIITKAGVNFRF
jgi:outer membrane immunogenic protein